MFDRKLMLNRVMLSAWFVNAVMMTGYIVIMPFVPLYVAELGVSDPASIVFWSGAIFAAFGVASFFTGPIMGSLSDRIGPRPIIAWGFVAACITFFLMGLTTNLYFLVALRFVQGFFGAGAPAATSAIVANTAPGRQMGQAFGFFQTSMTVGAGVGPLVGGIVADAVGLREAFFVAAGLMVVGLLATLAFIPPMKVQPTGPRPAPIEELRQIVGTRALLTVWVALVAMQSSMFFILPVFPLYLEGLGVVQVASTMGILMAITAVASTVATPLTGVLADRRGHRLVLIGSLLATGVATGVTALVTTVPQLVALRAAAGAAMAGIGPTTSTLAARAIPEHQRGGAFGMMSTARTIGVLVGPVIGAIVVQVAGINGAFVATGVIMSLVGVWIAREKLE